MTPAAVFVWTLLFSGVAGTLFVNLVTANFGPITVAPASPQIRVLSPISNEAYNTTSISLLFVVKAGAEAGQSGAPFVSSFRLISVRYLLDNTVQGQSTGDNTTFFPGVSKTYSDTFTGLSEGQHTLRIDVIAVDVYSEIPVSSTVYFTVDTIAPTVRFLPAPEKTYELPDVSLDFTVNEPVSWIGYSLDGQDTVTVTDTAILTRNLGRDNYYMVLTGLSRAGSHSLVVYAKDTAGNTGKSETLTFTDASEAQGTQPEPEQSESEQSFPTMLVAVAAAVIVAAVVCIGLLVYFKKRNN